MSLIPMSGGSGSGGNIPNLHQVDRPVGARNDQVGIYRLFELVNATFVNIGSLRPGTILDFVQKVVAYRVMGPIDFRDTGFSPAGPDAIGLIMIPSVQTSNALASILPTARRAIEDPHALDDAWGHTAIYVRSRGKIVAVVGFSPAGMDMDEANAVISGGKSTPGSIHLDNNMFNMVEAQTLEFPVTEQQALQAEQRVLRELGRPNFNYVTQPDQHRENPESVKNCLQWAIEVLEGIVGARLICRHGFPVQDLGPGGTVSRNASSQGRMIREVYYASQGGQTLILHDDLGPVAQYNNNRKAGGYPRSLRVLFAAQTFFLVAGVAHCAYNSIGPNLLPAQYGVPLLAGGAATAELAAQNQLTRVYEQAMNLDIVPAMQRLGLLGGAAVLLVAPGAAPAVLFYVAAGMALIQIVNIIMRLLR